MAAARRGLKTIVTVKLDNSGPDPGVSIGSGADLVPKCYVVLFNVLRDSAAAVFA